MQIVIIGAGIVGLHIANILNENGHDVFVLDQEKFLGEHTSGRNSGVIHAGIFYKTGSLKETFCIEGNQLTHEWVAKLKVPHLKCGKLVLVENTQKELRDQFIDRMSQLPISKVRPLTKSQVKEYAPNLREIEAVYIPSTGVLDAATYLKNFQVYLESKGVQIIFPCKVTDIKNNELVTNRGAIPFDLAINSAGLFADEIAITSGLNGYTIKPCRGDYYVATQQLAPLPVYHLPDPNALGLGVHFTPTLDGQTILGPNAYFIENKNDYGHRSEITEFANAIKFEMPELKNINLTPGYSGNRPKLYKNEKAVTEFVFEKKDNWIHLLGIESPGLTSAPAIAKHVLKLL